MNRNWGDSICESERIKVKDKSENSPQAPVLTRLFFYTLDLPNVSFCYMEIVLYDNLTRQYTASQKQMLF